MSSGTWIALANTTLSASAGSVTFSSIPATYRDLVLIASNLSRITSGATTIRTGLRINGDTSSTYAIVLMSGDGTSGAASSTNSQAGYAPSMTLTLGPTAAADESTISIINLMDYSVTDKHKTGLARSSYGGYGTLATAFRWPSTSAVTSLTLLTYDANTGSASSGFSSGGNFALYGIVS